MNRTARLGLVVALGALLSAATVSHATPRYVGVDRCKICHNRKDQTNQYEIWTHSKHASAYATLGTAKAREFAVKAGVKSDPQKAPQCLECHLTGYGLDTSNFKDSFVRDSGVQCEACHGPGSEYKAPAIMSAPKYAANREAQHKLALQAGLVMPDEKTCVKCHNQRSPAFTGFVYKDYYERIKHAYRR